MTFKNYILTIGVTCCQVTDLDKMKIMLTSLVDEENTFETFDNADTLNDYMETLKRNYYNTRLIRMRDFVQLIVNIDMKTSLNVAINTIQKVDYSNKNDNIPLEIRDKMTEFQIEFFTKTYKLITSIFEDYSDIIDVYISTSFSNKDFGRVSVGRNNILRNAKGLMFCLRDDDDVSVNIPTLVKLILCNVDTSKNLTIESFKSQFNNNTRSNELPIYIECGMLKSYSDYLSKHPIYTSWYPTNVIVNTKYLLKNNLYFNENTVAEDSFWRFNIYYSFLTNLVPQHKIKIYPVPIYGIYFKSFNTTNVERDRKNNYFMISSVMDELDHRHNGNIPLLMPHFILFAMLIEGEFVQKDLVKYMLNNYDKFVFRDYLKKIIDDNVNVYRLHFNIDDEIKTNFNNEFANDVYTIHMHARLRNQKNEKKFFCTDENYEINNAISFISKGIEYVKDSIIYERYIEDYKVFNKNPKKTVNFYLPSQLLSLIEITKVKDVNISNKISMSGGELKKNNLLVIILLISLFVIIISTIIAIVCKILATSASTRIIK